ncbi:hypothetical protein BDF21DRAFT_341234, partial [Thamnidium elegans]
IGRRKKEWVPKEQFFVNSIAITRLLYKFRRLSISKVENNNNIGSLRILSLSLVFSPLASLIFKKGITRYFDYNARKAYKSIFSNTKPKIRRFTVNEVIYCQKIANVS